MRTVNRDWVNEAGWVTDGKEDALNGNENQESEDPHYKSCSDEGHGSADNNENGSGEFVNNRECF